MGSTVLMPDLVYIMQGFTQKVTNVFQDSVYFWKECLKVAMLMNILICTTADAHLNLSREKLAVCQLCWSV